MTPRDALNNIIPIILFVLCGLSFVAMPIGLGVAILVRRMTPVITSLNVAILSVYIIGVVILFVILRRLFTDDTLGLYSAWAVSVVVSAGIVFSAVLMLRRYLRAHTPDSTIDQSFSVFGEDVRDKPRKTRR